MYFTFPLWYATRTLMGLLEPRSAIWFCCLKRERGQSSLKKGYALPLLPIHDSPEDIPCPSPSHPRHAPNAILVALMEASEATTSYTVLLLPICGSGPEAHESGPTFELLESTLFLPRMPVPVVQDDHRIEPQAHDQLIIFPLALLDFGLAGSVVPKLWVVIHLWVASQFLLGQA